MNVDNLIQNPRINASYLSLKVYGCDGLIRSHLGLDDDFVLPLSLTHGIDFYRDAVDAEVDSKEPIYIAVREDIAERVSKRKAVLRFPHPWLFLAAPCVPDKAEGTLFISPPPSEAAFEQMHARIIKMSLPKPWGILLKDRGLQRSDFDWWESRGFAAHTAGDMYQPRFFHNLRDIFARYSQVASPNMSSAVIFAVAMHRRAVAIPDIPISCVEVRDWDRNQDLEDVDGRVCQTWHALLGDDASAAKATAEELLGKRYMAEPAELRRRLCEAIEKLDRPIHLAPIGPGPFYRLLVWLLTRGIPVDRFFPYPFRKLGHKIAQVTKLNSLTVYEGSDFAHYGVAGSRRKFQYRHELAFRLGKSAMPGFAVRK